MRGWSVWKRLVWREAREGWLPVAAGLVAPTVLFPLARGVYPQEAVIVPAAVGVQLLVIFWASNKADRKRHGAEFAHAHLPIGPMADWAATFAVPLVAAAGIGAWYGSRAFHGTLFMSQYALAGMLDLATGFALSWFFSAVVSKWAGVFVGVAHMIGGNLINVAGQLFLDPQTVAAVIGVAAGSVIGSGVFAALESRKSLAFRQGVAMVALLVCGLAPFAPGIDAGWLFPKEGKKEFVSYWHSEDDTIVVGFDPRGGWFRPRMEFEDRLTGTTARRRFDAAARALAVAGRRYVYLAQRARRGGSILIVEWDTRSGSARTRARIPEFRGSLGDAELSGSADPRRRYLLVWLPALIGDGSDLWLVDMVRGKSQVAAPDIGWIVYGRVQSAVWTKDRVLLGGRRITEIDLRRARARTLAAE